MLSRASLGQPPPQKMKNKTKLMNIQLKLKEKFACNYRRSLCKFGEKSLVVHFSCIWSLKWRAVGWLGGWVVGWRGGVAFMQMRALDATAQTRCSDCVWTFGAEHSELSLSGATLSCLSCLLYKNGRSSRRKIISTWTSEAAATHFTSIARKIQNWNFVRNFVDHITRNDSVTSSIQKRCIQIIHPIQSIEHYLF